MPSQLWGRAEGLRTVVRTTAEAGAPLLFGVMAGALGGSGVTRASEGRVHNGMLSIYLDPARLDTDHNFLRDVNDYIGWVKSAEPIDKDSPVIIPGDKERKLAAKRSAEGLPLPEEVWQAILSAARTAGLSQDQVDTALKG
jgi:uncharacterized oxidoreductase